MYVAIPRNSRNSVEFAGLPICSMSLVHFGSGCAPPASKTRPKNFMDLTLDLTLVDVEDQPVWSCCLHQVVKVSVVLGFVFAEDTHIIRDTHSASTGSRILSILS